MSAAADPADPTRPYVNGPDDGTVIPIIRRRRGAVAAARERWTPMEDPSPRSEAGRPPGPVPEELLLFANDIEARFKGMQQSLTNPETAKTYLQTLDVFQQALEGTHARGKLGAEELAELTHLIRGLREVPNVL
jgi:hypothetical protein